MAGLLDFLQAASNAVAGNVSGPVDLLSMGLRYAGLPIPQDAVGSTEWMKKKGLLRDVPQSASSLAGETLGLLSPLAAARAPQIARGLLAAQEAAPGMMSRGAMAPANQEGIFAGTNAATANKDALRAAQKMTAAGADPREVWSKTGWFKGPDGKWRFEIDDSAAKFNTSKQGAATVENDVQHAAYSGSYGNPLNLLQHKELSAAYPSPLAKDTYVKNGLTMLRSERGAMDPATDSITLFAPVSAQEGRSTMLHELQHAVQGREGFAKGGSPNQFWDGVVNPKTGAQYTLDEGYDLYRRLLGEAEARAVQARMNMTPAERRATFPLDSYDVPIDQLIVR